MKRTFFLLPSIELVTFQDILCECYFRQILAILKLQNFKLKTSDRQQIKIRSIHCKIEHPKYQKVMFLFNNSLLGHLRVT